MIGYMLFWLLELNESVYLMTEKDVEPCTVTLTAKTPKKVSRSIDLKIDPNKDIFLMSMSGSRGIKWTHTVTPTRDENGKLTFDLTDILRQLEIPFGFCAPGKFRHYKAYTYELRRYLYRCKCGFTSSHGGFAWEDPASESVCFFPGNCYICGTEVHFLNLEGFGWSSRTLDERLRAMSIPTHWDAQTASRILVEENANPSCLQIITDLLSIRAKMFFLTSFTVEGFGRAWKHDIHDAMFTDGCAPCKVHLFEPLLCRLLEAKTAEEVDRALRWAQEENILI